jgi:MFS transporter, SP family, arabinose:H+ symporter
MNTKKKYNLPYIWMISLVAAMGGFLFGYDWVVIGGAKAFYEAYFGITSNFQEAWAMSSALAGCMLGVLSSGFLADKLGRKKLLITAGFLFTLSAAGTALSNSFNFFIVMRVMGGIGIGLASNLSPMYIAETSPPEFRGRFVSINQLTIVLGIASAQLINWLIANKVPDNADVEFIRQSWNGTLGWRWMFGAEMVPAFLFFLLMFFVPESPRWLAKTGKYQLAGNTLEKIGNRQYAETALNNIKESVSANTKGGFRLLFTRKMRFVLLLAVFLAIYQQWCGINVIFNYAKDIFESAGFGMDTILLNILGTGLISLAFTFVAIFTVDKMGRKKLMTIGAAGLALLFSGIGFAYLFDAPGFILTILIFTAMAFYSFSLAPITWVLISELFPNNVREAGMSVAVNALWAACFLLTYTFPYLMDFLNDFGTFLLYGGISVIGFLIVHFMLPETKGKTLEELEKQLVK